MIRINKGNEPQSWIEYKNTPGTTYTSHPELKEALLSEQGYICAYCMRRIPLKKCDPGESVTCKIEHIKSRSANREYEKDYKNMIMCCPGSIDGNAHCDKSKGQREITLSPFSDDLEKTISYRSKDGEIRSSNMIWNEEINNILCLNNPLLKRNRKDTLAGIQKVLGQKTWNTTDIRRKLQDWKSLDDDGKFYPYCGIVIWFLERRLRQTNKRMISNKINLRDSNL